MVEKTDPSYKPYQFIPTWVMPIMLIAVAGYTILESNKWHIIMKDLQEPRFIIVLILVLLFLFFVKDKNPERSQFSNDHAIIAGIAAYFGHLDMPLTAVFLAGTYSFYTFSKIKSLSNKRSSSPSPFPVYNHP